MRQARRRTNGRAIAFAAAALTVLICAGVVLLLTGHATPARRARPPAASAAPQPSRARSRAAAAPARLVAVAPGPARSPLQPGVASFLTRYFTAINSHDYAAYQVLFATKLHGGLSSAAFATGYGSSRDSRVILRGIAVQGGGQLKASVSFISHQLPADSATHSSCTSWHIALFLARHGGNYVIESPPASYSAAARSCS
jgi:hypothetical protein